MCSNLNVGIASSRLHVYVLKCSSALSDRYFVWFFFCMCHLLCRKTRSFRKRKQEDNNVLLALTLFTENMCPDQLNSDLFLPFHESKACKKPSEEWI